jgi:dTMP kinase
MTERAKFVVLDGIDGCGKTTQALRLVEALGAETGCEVVHLREPGSTKEGEAIRAILLEREHELSPGVETLLFTAARRQTLERLVAPALQRGAHVVCERFHPSTYAYQAHAGGLDANEVLGLLTGWAGDPEPDLVVLLDVPVSHALKRRGAPTDRIEDRGSAFQEQVAAGMADYAERMDRVVSVDGVGEPGEVAQRVLSEVRRVL